MSLKSWIVLSHTSSWLMARGGWGGCVGGGSGVGGGDEERRWGRLVDKEEGKGGEEDCIGEGEKGRIEGRRGGERKGSMVVEEKVEERERKWRKKKKEATQDMVEVMKMVMKEAVKSAKIISNKPRLCLNTGFIGPQSSATALPPGARCLGSLL